MIEVVAAILRDGNKVLLARRASHKSMPGKWELPGGKIESEEAPENALQRELLEEFNIEVKVQKHAYSTIHEYEDFSIKLMAFECDHFDNILSSIDHDKIEWVNRNDLLKFELAEADIKIVKRICSD